MPIKTYKPSPVAMCGFNNSSVVSRTFPIASWPHSKTYAFIIIISFAVPTMLFLHQMQTIRRDLAPDWGSIIVDQYYREPRHLTQATLWRCCQASRPEERMP